MKVVLFVCNHNAGRSQVAEAFFERDAPPDVRAESAGSNLGRAIWPGVLEAMNEIGIDLSDRKPRKLVIEMQLHADWAVTMGCATHAHMSQPRSRPGRYPTPRGCRSSRSVPSVI